MQPHLHVAKNNTDTQIIQLSRYRFNTAKKKKKRKTFGDDRTSSRQVVTDERLRFPKGLKEQISRNLNSHWHLWKAINKVLLNQNSVIQHLHSCDCARSKGQCLPWGCVGSVGTRATPPRHSGPAREEKCGHLGTRASWFPLFDKTLPLSKCCAL